MAEDVQVAILIKAKDLASKALQNVGRSGSRAGSLLKRHWKGAAVGMAAAGVALEVLGRKARVQNEAIEKTARVVGLTSDALRKLTIDTSNVTFPIEDAIALFELAGQQGLRSAEDLQTYATFWDTVGDASGESGVELGKAGTALRGMGIQLGKEKEAVKAFGFIMNGTTMKIGEFLTFLDKAGPELREMGLDVDDTAAIVGALTNELGMSARTARSEFIAAVTESKGDLGELYTILGITTEQVGIYSDKVANSGDVVQEMADIHAESYTFIQKVKQGISELTTKYGEQIAVAGNLAPVLIGLSTGLTAIVTVAPLVQAAFVGINLAMGPLGWAIAALVISMAALAYVIISNWDDIKFEVRMAIDFISAKLSELVKWFKKMGSGISFELGLLVGWVRDKFNSIVVIALSIGTKMYSAGKGMINEMRRGLDAAWSSFKAALEAKLQWIKDHIPWGSPSLLGPLAGKVLFSGGANIINEMLYGLNSRTSALRSGILAAMGIISDEVTQFTVPTPGGGGPTLRGGAQLPAEMERAQRLGGVSTLGEDLDRMAAEQQERDDEAEAQEQAHQEAMQSIRDIGQQGMQDSMDAFGLAVAQGDADLHKVLLAGMMRTIMAMITAGIQEIGVKAIIEKTKAFLAAPMSFGASLSAIPLITIAALTGVAALGAISFAEGGIVTRPVMGIVGDAGPEAIIPLDRWGGFGGGNVTNISITGPFMGTASEARMWARELIPYFDEENAR